MERLRRDRRLRCEGASRVTLRSHSLPGPCHRGSAVGNGVAHCEASRLRASTGASTRRLPNNDGSFGLRLRCNIIGPFACSPALLHAACGEREAWLLVKFVGRVGWTVDVSGELRGMFYTLKNRAVVAQAHSEVRSMSGTRVTVSAVSGSAQLGHDGT
jgi:hypothetical protein